MKEMKMHVKLTLSYLIGTLCANFSLADCPPSGFKMLTENGISFPIWSDQHLARQSIKINNGHEATIFAFTAESGSLKAKSQESEYPKKFRLTVFMVAPPEAFNFDFNRNPMEWASRERSAIVDIIDIEQEGIGGVVAQVKSVSDLQSIEVNGVSVYYFHWISRFFIGDSEQYHLIGAQAFFEKDGRIISMMLAGNDIDTLAPFLSNFSRCLSFE